VFAEFISRHPRLVISIVVISILITGYYASQVKIGVSTGSFQLKNSAYKTYKKILSTFGSETDDVLVVTVSKDGYIFNRGDIESILQFEMKMKNEVHTVSNESLINYVLTGMHLINITESLPTTLNISVSPYIFEDVDKIKRAIGNYTYVENNANDTIKNSTYRIFILLPEYSNTLLPENLSGPSGEIFNFTYPDIIKNSSLKSTVYNATTMLIEEIEIYQNLTEYGASGEMSSPNIPQNYSLAYLNHTMDSVDFNITRATVAMEHYNGTYMEWYSYNLSFNLALALLYSGYPEIALGVYNFEKTAMSNATHAYYSDYVNWTAYFDTLSKFKEGNIPTETVLNATYKMENRTFGTLRDFLDEYRHKLENYSRGEVSYNEIMNDTWQAENMSVLMQNYTLCSYIQDKSTIPKINETIAQVENHSGYSEAIYLTHISTSTMGRMKNKIVYFYGEKMILGKVKNILENLKSILVSNERPQIKQDAWDLLYFGGGIGNVSFSITPFYRALVSYRDTIYSNFYANTSSIFWNYLTLKPLSMNYSYNEVNISRSYNLTDMLHDVRNMNQSAINMGIEKVKNFKNETVERIIFNYTSELKTFRKKIVNLTRDSKYICNKYSQLGTVADNFTALLNNVTAMGENTTRTVNKSINDTYSMRQIEDFFSLRHMYFNTLLSRDSLSTLLIIGVYNSSYEMKIYALGKNMSSNPYVSYHTIASKVLTREIEETATYDMKTLLPLSLVFLVILLMLTYRSLKAVILSLCAVLIAMVWLFAFTVLIGWDFDPILLAVPIMIVGIGIDDGIYVTLRYMEEREHRDRWRATQVTVASVGGALVLTTLTSMVGFMSNSISSMEDIQRFGILAAAGLIFSFVAMNTFLPAANLIFDTRGKIKKIAFKPARIGAEAAVKVPYLVIAVVLVFSAAGVISFTHLNTEFTIRDLAPANSEIVKYYHYYERNFNASVEYSYIYMCGNLTNPAVLKAMVEVQKNIENDTTVVHDYPIISPWSIMKTYADARPGEYYYNATFIKLFRESDINHDGIPDRNISMLYSMLKPEISSVLRGDQAIIIVRTDSHDLKKVDTLVRELNADAKPLRKYVKVEIAGDAIVGKASIDEINENQLRSLFLSITAAIAMLVVLFMYTKKSFTLGIIAAMPIMVVVTWNWVLMYVLGISLNVMTNTIASLCVGLGVDYGIHITHRFVEESHRYYDLKTALFRATERMGRGLVGAAATTIAAIGILTLSTIPPLSSFALILSFSILFAFIASIFFLPSLLLIWANFRRKHGYDNVDKKVVEGIKNGDIRILCMYHLSESACVEYVYSLIKKGKIAEARNIAAKMKEEGMDLSFLFRSSEEVHPPFE